MSVPAGAQSAPITVSESAAKRIAFLRDQGGNPDVMLRVTVLGGGCSGFQYNFDFDTESGEDDVLVERGDIILRVDGTPVTTLDDVGMVMEKIRRGETVVVAGCRWKNDPPFSWNVSMRAGD